MPVLLGLEPASYLPSHGNENPTYVLLFWEKRGLSPNFHIHVYVSDLFSPRIGLHISSYRIGRRIVGIYKSLTVAWMWKLGLRPRYSISGNIFFEISVFCLCSAPQDALPHAFSPAWHRQGHSVPLYLYMSLLHSYALVFISRCAASSHSSPSLSVLVGCAVCHSPLNLVGVAKFPNDLAILVGSSMLFIAIFGSSIRRYAAHRQIWQF